MLAGYPPFMGENDLEIVKKVKSGKFTLNVPELSKVSVEAKLFLEHLLRYDPEQRLSAEQALQCTWIKLYD